MVFVTVGQQPIRWGTGRIWNPTDFIAGFYAIAPNPGGWKNTTFLLNALSNLSDGSWLVRLDYRAVFLTSLTVDAHVGFDLGQRGEFRFGFNVPPQPGSQVLATGLDIEPPVLDVGVGILMSL